jgi:hypothetical protein
LFWHVSCSLHCTKFSLCLYFSIWFWCYCAQHASVRAWGCTNIVLFLFA